MDKTLYQSYFIWNLSVELCCTEIGVAGFFFSPLDICKYRIPQLPPLLTELFTYCSHLSRILEHIWSCPMYNYPCRGIIALSGQQCSLLWSYAVSTRAVCFQIAGCAMELYCFMPATDLTLRVTDTTHRPLP